MDWERNTILLWAEQRRLAPEKVLAALHLVGALPQGGAWRRFLDHLLLWSGTALVASGVVYFVAANWELLGRFARFGLLEVLIAGAVGVALWLGIDRPAGKAALLGAALCTGALLALFGQTYQTGADTFELFVIWAAMILPWVLLGRHGTLWMLWLILVNLAIVLYFHAFRGFGFGSDLELWLLFAFNTMALVAWEAAALRLAWLTGRWGPRVLALASGSLITSMALMDIFDGEYDYVALAVHVGWLGTLYFVYRRVRFDLFMLAGGVLCVIVAVAGLLTRTLFHSGSDEVALLIIAAAVIGLSALGGRWLMNISREVALES